MNVLISWEYGWLVANFSVDVKKLITTQDAWWEFKFLVLKNSASK